MGGGGGGGGGEKKREDGEMCAGSKRGYGGVDKGTGSQVVYSFGT